MVLTGTFGLILGPVTPALAYAPSPTPGASVAATGPGQTVCTINDRQLVELSGMAATANGYVVENDSNSNGDAIRVFFLDSQCRRKSAVNYPTRARDPEDLALQADGTIWVADTGDNPLNPSRENIGLWRVPAGGTGKITLYHFTYPSGDGPHDAEALLLGSDNSPIFVTKAVTGPAGIYVPTGQLDPSGKAVPLKKVGQFQPQRTGTDNPVGVPGQNTVTGGAKSPDGKRVALRTYSDAYEWDVPDGDVIKAITGSKPRITPLPGEPLGEAIAYSPDGSSFLTVADQTGPVKILRYRPAVATTVPTRAPGGVASPPGDTRSWFSRLSLRQITYLVAAVGLIGLVLVVVGVLGIRRSRKNRRAALAASRERSTGADVRSPAGDQPARTYASGTYGGGTYSSGSGYGSRDYEPPGGYNGGGYDGGGYRQQQPGQQQPGQQDQRRGDYR
jgi:hypothetical protein